MNVQAQKGLLNLKGGPGNVLTDAQLSGKGANFLGESRGMLPGKILKSGTSQM